MKMSKDDLLVGIGATVGANCIPCMETLVAKAHEARIDEDEIRHAIQVGRMVRQGAAAQWDGALSDLLGDSAMADAEATGCPFS